MRTAQHGFTLIELMIVVAIIGVLAAIALPAFQDYSIRAKMSEVILAMSGCRVSITEFYQSGSSSPGAGNWGCERVSGSQYVSEIATDDDGKVTATVRNINSSLNGSVVTYVPLQDATTPASASGGVQGLFGWRCGGLADGTTVPAKYLPSSCRG